MFWRMLYAWLVPDRALRVGHVADEVRVVIRPEIGGLVDAARLVRVVPERDERTWWPGVGVVVRPGERLSEFLTRIEAECDDA